MQDVNAVKEVTMLHERLTPKPNMVLSFELSHMVGQII